MNLGEKQELTAVKKVEFGMYLAENPEDETRVLLPAKQVPEGPMNRNWYWDSLQCFRYWKLVK